MEGWNAPDEAYIAMKDALTAIGRVTGQDPARRLLLGTAQDGFHRVHVVVSITQLGTGSEVRVRAQGDNVWGRGKPAKTVAWRLVEVAEGGLRETWR